MLNNLTDTEIKKALECCTELKGKHACRECPLQFRDGSCTTILVKHSLDLINRQEQEIEKQKDNYMELLEICSTRGDIISKQKVENESLKAEVERLKNAYLAYEEISGLKQAKVEAYNKFAYLLKKIPRTSVLKNEIDNILNELVGNT